MLVDVDPITMNIDSTRIVDAVTPKTKAIVPVHFAGLPCDMNGIMAIAAEQNLKVIEDCAHAIETHHQGRPAGTIGDFGCFSFYSTKNITTCEGGMIVARDERHAEQLRRLALHGMSKDAWKRFSDSKFRHYSVTEVGFKYNMTDLNAAIGLHQLRRIEEFVVPSARGLARLHARIVGPASHAAGVCAAEKQAWASPLYGAD